MTANVKDLMTPGHLFLWIVLGCLFPPWFIIHPIMVLIIYHKRANPSQAPHELVSYDGPQQLTKPFLPFHTVIEKEPEPIPQSHWDSVNAFKERKRHEQN